MPEATLERAVREALAESLGEARLELREWRRLGGGCISPAARLLTTAGAFFVKWNAAGPADLFTCEAAGLAALAAAASGLHVPRVFAACEPHGGAPGFIVLEHIETTRAASLADEERLGRGLAALHACTAQAFGFDGASYCGSTRQENEWCSSWPEFYAERRLRPLVASLDARGELGTAERRSFERLLGRLQALLLEDARPALVHGDLWAGNVLWGTDGPALVDPACAFAEREFELGIATLFGGLSARALEAYGECAPLAPGWRERNPLYQLYHLLNHALLFGGGYLAQALGVARRFV